MPFKTLSIASHNNEFNLDESLQTRNKNCWTYFIKELAKDPANSLTTACIIVSMSALNLYLATQSKNKDGITANGVMVEGTLLISLNLLYFIAASTVISFPKIVIFSPKELECCKEAYEENKNTPLKKTQWGLNLILMGSQIITLYLQGSRLSASDDEEADLLQKQEKVAITALICWTIMILINGYTPIKKLIWPDPEDTWVNKQRNNLKVFNTVVFLTRIALRFARIEKNDTRLIIVAASLDIVRFCFWIVASKLLNKMEKNPETPLIELIKQNCNKKTLPV